MRVDYMVSICSGSDYRTRFHGTNLNLINQQAKSLGLTPISVNASDQDLESAFQESLDQLIDHDVRGVIFGDIALDSVRTWYQDRVEAAGLEHIEPNWGEPSIEIAWEVVERGYQALVVSVNRARRATKFLGREFDADLVTEIGCTDGLDPSGERGEYHTFVFDGPEFMKPVEFSLGDRTEFDEHRVIELTPSRTP